MEADDDELPQESLHTDLPNQEHLDKKEGVSLSSKKFANDIIKTLTVYIDIAERIEEEYKKTSVIINQIENFYNKEKDTLVYYKRLLAEKKLATKEVYYHASDIQDALEIFEENFAELIRISRMMIPFFPDKGDRNDYNNKINGACILFNHIYQDIEDIAFEEQNIIKTL